LRCLPALLAVAMAGCAVGPEFVRPDAPAPTDWRQWTDQDNVMRGVPVIDGIPQGDWWGAYRDPVLDGLQRRAQQVSPDLQTAALHLAQARVQRQTVAAQRLPEVDLTGGVTRQRQSEFGAATRVIDAISNDRQPLVDVLSQPFTLYQAGFDASWELDLWGRIRRSVQAADADVQRQAALLDMTRLSVASEVTRAYFELRTAQKQEALTREDIAALEDRLGLLQARVDAGVIDHLDLERLRAELAGLKARLPSLLVQQSDAEGQLALLVGQMPGQLAGQWQPPAAAQEPVLPELALGIPSEVAQRRPDIRAAEARLRNATASVGIAQADLYPSIRLGARFGYESYLSGEFSDWGSRTWSIGPVLNLPIFDHGRRKGVVRLRELQQQEAAVSYQHTVLQAWQEIDGALSRYAANSAQGAALKIRERSSHDAYALAQAKYRGGTTDFSTVLDSQRVWIQARRDVVDNEGQRAIAFATVNKAIGNGPVAPPTAGP
jgi:NodT family efflux transporter outer membrane factor (OMF) lipoprotein